MTEFVPAMIDLFALGTAAAERIPVGRDHGSSSKPQEPVQLAVIAARLLPGPALRTVAAAVALVAIGAYAYRRAA